MNHPNQSPFSNPQSRIPDHQSWQLLVFLFALANFLEVAVVAHFVLFTPAFLHTIGFSKNEIDAWTGPISSLAFLFGIWFVPFWGVFADRYGRKPLILRSNYVEVIAMALAAIANNVWLYVFARALTGLALGNTGLMYASLTEAAPKNRVALALGSGRTRPRRSVRSSADLVGGWIVSEYGVHTLFGVDAVVCLITAIILTALYRETFTPKPTPPVFSDARRCAARGDSLARRCDDFRRQFYFHRRRFSSRIRTCPSALAKSSASAPRRR